MQKILVIDDDELHRRLLYDVLSAKDYEVLLAEDRPSAIAAFRESRPMVVVLDLGLPPSPGAPEEGMAALAELLTLEAAWKFDRKTVTDMDMAMAKLKATEMLAFVADEAIQIHGGMGLMSDLPLERIWRDARVERIWEGTSEIQRHIISRSLLRSLGG